MATYKIASSAGKQALLKETKAAGIKPADSKRLLAMGMVEGDLTKRTDFTPGKKGTDAECHGMFNLNTSQLRKGGLTGSEIKRLDHADATGNIGEAMHLSVKALSKLLKTYHADGLERLSRTGSATGTAGYDSYAKAINNSVKDINADKTAFTDNKRFAYDVPNQ